MNCSKCKKETPYSSFSTFRDRNGGIRRRGICKECRGQYAIENFERLQEWRKAYNAKNRTAKREKDARRRAEVKAYVDKIKSQSPCADCGHFFPAVAMDFDHIHGKNKSISGLVSGAYKMDLIIEEIKMCEIVCACCHRVRTHDRKQNHAPNKRAAA
jgi:hypothetical protein